MWKCLMYLLFFGNGIGVIIWLVIRWIGVVVDGL